MLLSFVLICIITVYYSTLTAAVCFILQPHAGGRPSTLPPIVLQNLKDFVLMQVQKGVAFTARDLKPYLISAIEAMNFQHILAENGGPFCCSESWVKLFLVKLGLTRRVGTRDAQHLPNGWQQLHQNMIFRLANKVFMNSIPRSQVVNLDQTGVLLAGGHKKTYATKGTRYGVYLIILILFIFLIIFTNCV